MLSSPKVRTCYRPSPNTNPFTHFTLPRPHSRNLPRQKPCLPSTRARDRLLHLSFTLDSINTPLLKSGSWRLGGTGYRMIPRPAHEVFAKETNDWGIGP